MRRSERTASHHASHITDYRNVVVQIHLLFYFGLRCTALHPLAAGVRLASELFIKQTRSPAGPNDQVPALRDVYHATKRHRCLGRRVLFPELRAVREQGLIRNESRARQNYASLLKAFPSLLSEGE